MKDNCFDIFFIINVGKNRLAKTLQIRFKEGKLIKTDIIKRYMYQLTERVNHN